MNAEVEFTVEECLLKIFKHLGIKKAHFAARVTTDWEGLATSHPEIFSSLILVSPQTIDQGALSGLSSQILVFTGDQEPTLEILSKTVEGYPNATAVTLQDYSNLLWSDVVADRKEEVGSEILDFLEAVERERDDLAALGDVGEEGEVAGINYTVRGSGPPLFLLPLALAPSQWEPLLPRLSEKYSAITLYGPELGIVARIEERGRSEGYLRVFGNLVNEVGLKPGEEVLEVGCGTGALTRWLSRKTNGANRIIGADISRFLLREARALALKENLEGKIEYQEGNAENLPFPDNAYDVTLSSTVMEEVDAEKMMAEMVRVTKPGGRVGAIVRSEDMPSLLNLPLQPDLKAKMETPGFGGAGVGERGCADFSLYRRFHQAGLTQVKMFPQLATYIGKERLKSMGNMYLSFLNSEEAQEWKQASQKAEKEGTFFISQPVHSAVGTKPE